MPDLEWKDAYFEYLGNQSADELSYVGIVDENGDEYDYDDTIYERQPVEWEVESDGTISPTEDLEFDIPGSDDEDEPNIAAGFLVFDSETGGTNYGGKALEKKEYIDDGQYIIPKDKIFVSFSNIDV